MISSGLRMLMYTHVSARVTPNTCKKISCMHIDFKKWKKSKQIKKVIRHQDEKNLAGGGCV